MFFRFGCGLHVAYVFCKNGYHFVTNGACGVITFMSRAFVNVLTAVAQNVLITVFYVVVLACIVLERAITL